MGRHRTAKQNIKKNVGEMNSTDLTDIYRKLCSMITELTFFLSARGIVNKTEHFLCQKQTSTNLRELKSYTDHKETGLEISNKRQ